LKVSECLFFDFLKGSNVKRLKFNVLLGILTVLSIPSVQAVTLEECAARDKLLLDAAMLRVQAKDPTLFLKDAKIVITSGMIGLLKNTIVWYARMEKAVHTKFDQKALDKKGALLNGLSTTPPMFLGISDSQRNAFINAVQNANTYDQLYPVLKSIAASIDENPKIDIDVINDELRVKSINDGEEKEIKMPFPVSIGKEILALQSESKTIIGRSLDELLAMKSCEDISEYALNQQQRGGSGRWQLGLSTVSIRPDPVKEVCDFYLDSFYAPHRHCHYESISSDQSSTKQKDHALDIVAEQLTKAQTLILNAQTGQLGNDVALESFEAASISDWFETERMLIQR
jgi:hypothetical protein